MGDDWNEPRDKGPEEVGVLGREEPFPPEAQGKRKKEPVEDKSADHSLAYAFHSAYRS